MREKHKKPGCRHVEARAEVRRPGEGGSQEAVTPEGKDDLYSRTEGRPRSPARPRETLRPERAAT